MKKDMKKASEKYCGSCGKTEKQVKLRLLRITPDGSRLYVCSIGCGCRAEVDVDDLKKAVVEMMSFYAVANDVEETANYLCKLDE